MKKQTGKLFLSVTGYLVMSASLLLMPFQELGNLPGLLFWLGLAAGVLSQLLLRRAYRRELGHSRRLRCGWITFGANPWAKAADIGLAGSLLAAVLLLTVDDSLYLCYVALAATVFCFCMHCILNGRLFGLVVKYGRSGKKTDRAKYLKKEMDRDGM